MNEASRKALASSYTFARDVGSKETRLNEYKLILMSWREKDLLTTLRKLVLTSWRRKGTCFTSFERVVGRLNEVHIAIDAEVKAKTRLNESLFVLTSCNVMTWSEIANLVWTSMNSFERV